MNKSPIDASDDRSTIFGSHRGTESVSAGVGVVSTLLVEAEFADSLKAICEGKGREALCDIALWRRWHGQVALDSQARKNCV